MTAACRKKRLKQQFGITVLRQAGIRVNSVTPRPGVLRMQKLKNALARWEPMAIKGLSKPVAENVKKNRVLWPVVGQKIALHAVPAYKAHNYRLPI